MHPNRFRAAPRSPRTTLAVALSLTLAGALAPASAAVVISQLYGGGGNSGAPFNADFVELRNTGSSPVTLTGWSLQYASATGSSWSRFNLSGSIPAGGFFLVQLAGGANGSPLPVAPDQTGTAINMSGTAGKLALVANTTALSGTCPIPSATVLDFVGYGSANCSEGGTPAPGTANATGLTRANAGCTDTQVNGSDFSVVTPAPRHSGTAAPACGGAVEPPPPPPPPPPAPPPADAPLETSIPAVQGTGAKSPLEGQNVAVQGVVTRLISNGFFLQDPAGDGNPATSDGIFVYTGSTSYPAAVVGNRLRVVGRVTEFNVGSTSNAQTLARPLTELTNLSEVSLLGTGSVVPTPITLPLGQGDLERYEGMLVSISGPFTISQNAFQARYGQITLAAGTRLETPTNRHRPGSAQALALAQANAARRLILDDGSSAQYPATTPYLNASALPRTGDVLVGPLTGVVDFGLATASNAGPADYKLHPTVAPQFGVANPRTPSPAAVGGNVKVGSFNVLNYFTTFTNGQNVAGQTGQGCTVGSSTSAGNCRGADNVAEFERQRSKIVEALAAIHADAFGLMEVQNNGTVALQNLVDALNARVGAGTYAVAPTPAQGTGTDAIRTAVIYKPARMTALTPTSDANPVHERPPLAQPFVMPNGERFVLVVNHLKSKGSCPGSSSVGNTDSGDGQGCWNARRVQQAQRLRSFVTEVQTATGIQDALLVGDFNAYAMEDPIHDLTSNGYVDLIERYEPGAYSYVFDAAAGRLDHLIATPSLAAKAAGATHWHINADEGEWTDYNLENKAPALCSGQTCPPDLYAAGPYRSSDHDPIVAGLNIYKTLVAVPSSTSLTGTPGDDILVSGAGRRTLTGGAGNDQFQFSASFTGGATLTDFQPGADTIHLRAVLQALGIASATPIAQGYLSCRSSGGDAVISLDPDAAGPALPRAMLLIKGQPCAVLHPSNFVF
ncbi:MAG: ExeM/NucH family extracellular endonuclease [Inhella sp.]|jgi:predicted extracellular nuclease|uniref:ExeM/NucH family extracellular endonuclease n=1 Tax=Inhella sp. TaxID=1921806 RepID=UPI0022CABCD2|nr:ExeM/NucH family extracellular endonuclease [Inhella sp.]MCZ8234555.1 ExeM/NucH family extracellular endonuclease [Inhella sp.]